MINIDPPNLHGKTEAEKTEEIRRYLFQLVQALNFNFNEIDSKISDITKGEHKK